MLMTVKDAAAAIGVSTARIRKLISQGRLMAVKQGGSWLVDADSLNAYAEHASVGRPPKSTETAQEAAEHFTLMSGCHEVAAVTYSPGSQRFTQLIVLDEARLPYALQGYTVRGNRLNALDKWWGHRGVPEERPDLMFRLLELELDSPWSIPFSNRGLSMSDQYWLRPQGSTVRWEDVSYYRNNYDLGEDPNRESMSEWLTAVGLNSPDNTTDGMLSKRWIVDDAGRKVLIKGSSRGGREALNEVIATRLYRRLLNAGEYVEYRLGQWHGQDVAVCESFLREDEEFIPAWHVFNLKKRPNNRSEYRHYYEICADLGVLDAVGYLDRMIVCDSILANVDRHWRNFGIIRNVDTLRLRPAPVFDSGTCLWPEKAGKDFAAGDYGFATKPFHKDPRRQLELVCDGRWYHPEALEGFVEEAQELMVAAGEEQVVVDGICRGLQQRIDEVNAWWCQLPTTGLQGEWAKPEQMVEWVWL